MTNIMTAELQVISHSQASRLEVKHACHAFIFARDSSLFWNEWNRRAAVMMHLRFDGMIGFPGGLVDPGENLEEGLTRELHEEIGLDSTKYPFVPSDHIISHYNCSKNICFNFYGKEVSLEEFKVLEANILVSKEYGIEVLGPLRPPLYTYTSKNQGFPAYLKNNFVANSKEQLLFGLEKFNILTSDEIKEAVNWSIL